MKQSFYGGVHPNDRKELARHKEVAPLSAAPKAVVIAMAMHVGAPCKPIVAVGDQVQGGPEDRRDRPPGAPPFTRLCPVWSRRWSPVPMWAAER